MLSPVTPNNLLKMHWSGDHGAPLSPWAEQHLDVSSTTSPPGGLHKHHNADPYGARRPPASGYGPPAASGYPTWASDDISALSASSLLKRYAEKYSGLEMPCYDSSSRPLTAGCYATEGPPGPYLKTEAEPWGPPSALECYPGLEALAGGKVAVVATSDTGYGSASSPQDYPPAAYNGTSYLPAGYCPQPHALQSSYSPSTAVYNYTPVGCYPSSHTYSHPGASYPPPLPLGPPRPTVVGGSGYGGYSPASHTSLGGGGSPEGGVVALKRKAFEMSEDGEEDGGGAEDEDSSRYRKYGNGHGANKSHGGNNNNGHYGMGSPSAPPDPHDAYKSGGKPLMSPPYGGAGDYSPPAGGGGGLSGEGGGAGAERHGFLPQQRMTAKMPTAHARSEDPTGGR